MSRFKSDGLKIKLLVRDKKYTNHMFSKEPSNAEMYICPALHRSKESVHDVELCMSIKISALSFFTYHVHFSKIFL